MDRPLTDEARGEAPVDAASIGASSIPVLGVDSSQLKPTIWERKDVWNDRRMKLLQWLRRQPGTSEQAVAYEGAITLLSVPDFPGRARFICHALRDIADELPVALAGRATFTQTNYANGIDAIIKDWPQKLLLQNGIPEVSKDTFEIPRSVFVVIDGLVAARRRASKGSQKADALFRGLLRLHSNSPAPSARLINSFKKLRDWLVHRAHFRDKAPQISTENELVKEVERFEHIIHSCIDRFFSTTDALDAILSEANK